MIPEERSIVNLNFIFGLQFAPHRLRDSAHALRQIGVGGDGELLGRVAHGDLRLGVHFDNQAVRPGGDPRQGQAFDVARFPRTTGTAAISSVLRVAVSKVRIPRSHSTTL